MTLKRIGFFVFRMVLIPLFAGVNTTSPGVDSVSWYRLFSVKITTGGVGDNTPESKSNELKCENQCFEMPRLHCQKINNFDTPETR